MVFIKSKATTFRNRPVGVVSSNTGATDLAVSQANLFNSVQKIAWEEAKNDAIKKDVNTAKTLVIEDANGKISFERPRFTAVGSDKANAILSQRYANAMINKTNKYFNELHAKNKLDKETFDTKAQNYILGLEKTFRDNGMADYIPEFKAKIVNKQVLHSNKILNDTIEREERIAGANKLIAVENTIGTLETLQYDIENFEFADIPDLVEGDILQKKKDDIAVTQKNINAQITELIADGHIKAPKAQELRRDAKRNLAFGVINNAVDALGENSGAIKGIEQLIQSKKPSQQLINTLLDSSVGTLTLPQLQKIHDLRKTLSLDKTDMDFITRRISDRSGDANKLTNGLLKNENTAAKGSAVLNGTSTDILKNTQGNRDMLQSGLIKNLNIDKFDLETFFTLPRDKYDMMLKNLANAPFLPNTIHNLYSTNNFLSRPPFNNAPLGQKQILAQRHLDTWRNIAYNPDKSAKLTGYDDVYFKMNTIDHIARVNGGDIVKAYDLVNRLPANEKEVNNAVLTTVNAFDADADVESVSKGLEFVLEKANVPRHSWTMMKPYAKKLLFYKQLKGIGGENVDFSFDGVKEVLLNTYETMFIEDENIMDLFHKDTDIRTIYSPKRKYGKLYDDFIAYGNKELFDNAGNDYGGIGDDVFLLPDFRNSQFGDQRFTFVNKFGVPIIGKEGVPLTFNTIEFDKKNAIDTEELRKQSLNNTFNNRLIKIANSKRDGGLYKPKFMQFEYGDMFTPISPRAGGFGYDGFKGGPVVPRQFVGGFTERMLNLPINTEVEKTEISEVDGYGMVNPTKLSIDSKRAEEELKDAGFTNYVNGLETNYLENKILEKGYENPAWRIITKQTIDNFSLKDKVMNLYEEFITPDVAVEIQDNMIDISKYTAKHEGYRTGTYRDRNTISLGFGFNVRYLEDADYAEMPTELVQPLKDLQSKLLSGKFNGKELLKMANDFKRNNIGLPKEVGIKMYNNKIKKIYDTYNEEFENFSNLATARQAALIDFSYQFGHERLKGKNGFPKYYEAITNAINAEDIDLRNYYFKLAGFHQVYNEGKFGPTKTPLYYQTARRVKDRVGNLGFHIRDNVDFLNNEYM